MRPTPCSAQLSRPAASVDPARTGQQNQRVMGRLLPFLQLSFAVCAAAFFALWGALPAVLAVAPLLAATAVWPIATLRRAVLDGWGADPLRRARPESVSIWRFLEGMALPGGFLGASVFVLLALAGHATGAGALAGLCCAEAAGVFLIFRVVRQTVDLLQARPAAVIPGQLSAAAAARFGLSPREREVAALLAEGLRYEEIAARLFISAKTVKTHVHRLYEKTESRNRMELANRLRT
jgi:DNA-binding CsgD family transcriptional regulator